MMKKNISELIKRHKKLYSGSEGALVYIRNISLEKNVPIPKIGDFNMPTEYKKFIKAYFDSYIINFLNRKEIDDDIIPSIRPRLGIQEHSSFISGNNECQVDFVGETSFHHQMIFEKDDLNSLYLSEDNKYFQLLKDCYTYLTELSKDKCFVALRGTNLALDIANTIRGNDLLYDFYDDEKWTRDLLSFCNKAAIWYTNHQLNWVDKVEGGYITGFGVWMEGDSVGHLAEDGTCLIGPNLYEEFCLDLTNDFLKHYGGAFMHVHSIASASIPLIVKNDKIKVVEISTDPNSYTAIEIIQMYGEELKGKVLNISCTFDDIKNNLDLFKGKRVIFDINCKDKDEANKILNFIRRELPIKPKLS